MEKIVKLTVINGSVTLPPLPDGDYILYALKEEQSKDISYYQRLYGALKNTLYKEGETGYTPKEIHELYKGIMLPEMFTENRGIFFKNATRDGWSTKDLTIEGWKYYIDGFKIFAQEHFNCYV